MIVITIVAIIVIIVIIIIIIIIIIITTVDNRNFCMRLVQGKPGPGAEQDPAGKADSCHSEGEGCPSAGGSQSGPAPRGDHP